MRITLTLLALLTASVIVKAQSPQLVYDINRGTGSSGPTGYTAYGGKLYFSADDGGNGRELWVYNGAGQPQIAASVLSGPGAGVTLSAGQATTMVDFGGKLYFTGTDDSVGTELLSYTATDGVSIAADIVSGSNSSIPDGLMAFNNKLYFAARQRNSSGNELYSFDGSSAPVMYDINPGAGGSNPLRPVSFRNKLYFSAAVSAGRELYTFDPATGISTLMDINAGPGSSSPTSLLATADKLYFIATEDATGTELYSYDGTTVSRIAELTQGAGSSVYGNSGLALLGDNIYFAGSIDGSNYQLYQYNLTNGATALVKTINTSGSANPFGFTVYAGKVYFAAFTSNYGYELWATDGLTTTMMGDVSPNAASSTPTSLYVNNGTLYLTAATAATGAEMYQFTPTLGIRNLSFAGKVKAYPLPTSGDLNFSLDLGQAMPLQISLTDASGKSIWQQGIVSYPAGMHIITAPMFHYAAGIYYYQVRDDQGHTVASGNISKQ